MIAAAFLLLSLGYLGLYAGFTGTDPRDEVKAVFQGHNAKHGSIALVPLSPDDKRAAQTAAQHATNVYGSRA